MPQNPVKPPSRRVLLIAGAAALVIAGVIVTVGIVTRANTNRQLAQWTNQQAIPTVQLAKLGHGEDQQRLILPGNIQPYQKAEIYARVSGYLKSWEQDIGAKVKSGQLLASIDTPDLDQQLAQAQANLATAEANEQLAAVTAQRWESLLKTQAVSQQAVDDKVSAAASTKAIADAARASVGQLEAQESFKSIVAPFDGIVTQRNTDVGALINAGSGSSAGLPLFEVADLATVRIYVQVPQSYSAGLIPGLKATFDVPQYPGQQYDATLATTSNALDPSSRNMLVELHADNPDGKFAEGAYSKVYFDLPVDPSIVRLPASALMPVNSGAQVALVGADNKVVLKSIQLGRDFGDSVEVTVGLTPQDRVIDSPPETLQNGDVVQIATATPAPQAGPPAPAKGN